MSAHDETAVAHLRRSVSRGGSIVCGAPILNDSSTFWTWEASWESSGRPARRGYDDRLYCVDCRAGGRFAVKVDDTEMADKSGVWDELYGVPGIIKRAKSKLDALERELEQLRPIMAAYIKLEENYSALQADNKRLQDEMIGMRAKLAEEFAPYMLLKETVGNNDLDATEKRFRLLELK